MLGLLGRDAEAALGELYRRYEGRIFGVATRLLTDRNLAEDVVQETFTKLWRNASGFDRRRGTPGAFIMTIAQRTTIDLWRRPSSRPFLQEPPETGLEDPRFDRLLTAVTVRDALDALSPAHREVLELCFTEDLSRDQVAERVGVPVGTVKTRLYYGLRALRLTLEERGFDA